MPYAIPAQVRYEERLFGPFTVKQTAYIAIGGGIAGYAYMFSDWAAAVKIIVSAVAGLLTVGFVMFNLDVWLVNILTFARAAKKTSWISPAARQLLGIGSVRADAVILKDNRVLGLIKVKPINFGVLGEEDKDTVIYGFLEFLNALNFPIQIVMRSVNLDLEDYLRQLKRRILQRDDKMALSYYDHFAEYMRSYISVNKINDRHFYIVITAEKQKNEKSTLDNLDGRCNTIMSTLSLSGIVSERMNTHQLINFFSSYFTETFEIYETFISPITMYRKMWKEAPKHREIAPTAPSGPAGGRLTARTPAGPATQPPQHAAPPTDVPRHTPPTDVPRHAPPTEVPRQPPTEVPRRRPPSEGGGE